MGTQTVTKEQITRVLDSLPAESLSEVQQFLDFLRFKQGSQSSQPPAALGGLLEGYRFTDEEITRARRDMWSRFDDDPSWTRT
jgi:hypothetical protein